MSVPVVSLDSIPSHGLEVEVGEWGRAAAAEGLGGELTSLRGHLSVRRVGRHLAVQGELAGSAQVPCDRCAERVHLAVGGDVSCVYSPVDALPTPDSDEEPDGPALPDDLPFAVRDVGEYDGQSLDLRDVVREHFTVERPAVVRCGDVDATADAACHLRWRALSGAPDPSESSPFSALKAIKTPR